MKKKIILIAVILMNSCETENKDYFVSAQINGHSFYKEFDYSKGDIGDFTLIDTVYHLFIHTENASSRDMEIMFDATFMGTGKIKNVNRDMFYYYKGNNPRYETIRGSGRINKIEDGYCTGSFEFTLRSSVDNDDSIKVTKGSFKIIRGSVIID